MLRDETLIVALLLLDFGPQSANIHDLSSRALFTRLLTHTIQTSSAYQEQS